MRCAAAILLVLSALALAQGPNTGDYGTAVPPGVITGEVLAAGAPVEGALVTTYAGHTATTDVEGRYRIEVEAAGLYTVVIRVEGQEDTVREVEVALGEETVEDVALVLSLEDSLTGYGAALQARIDAIGVPPSKAAKKEAKGLGKARKALAKFTLPDKKGLKAIAKAIKGEVKTATVDAGIPGARDSVLTGLAALAATAQTDAETARDALAEPKNVAKIQKLVDRNAALSAAAPEAEPVVAAKLYAKAIPGFGKAVAKAGKLLARERK